MSDASSAMEIETSDTKNKLNKPLMNGSSKHDSEESLQEKFKLTISKINTKISQLDNILRKLNEKQASSNSKYNTRKRKTNSFVQDYDPSDDYVIPSTKRKSVSSSPVTTSTSGGRRSRRSSASINDVRSPRRVQRTTRRRPSQPLHPNVIEALEYGRKVIQDLRKHKYAYPFLKPVDPVALKIPDYFDVIKEPMDLGTVKERLDTNYYASVQDFIEDTRLIWSNAMTYNHPDSDVYKMAKTLSDIFEENVKKAIEIAEKTTEETIKEYKEKIETYQQMIADYEKKINEIREQMPKDVIPIIEVKKIKSTAKTNRPMHYEEKVRLSKMINELDEKYYSGIISIIEQEMPDVLKTDSEELELDIDELEPYVLWRLDDFLNTYVTTLPKDAEQVEVKQEPTDVSKKGEGAQNEDIHDDSSSSDSDSESSDSDSDSDDESSIEADRNVLVSKTQEASVSNGTTTKLDRSVEVPSIVEAEIDVKNVEIQNPDSWSKFNVSEENNDASSKNDAYDKDNKESDPLWQEFLNRGKQNLQRAEQEEKLRKEREQKEKEELERIQREEEEKRERERKLEEEAKKKREEEIRRRREEERRKREQEMSQASSGGLMETLY